MNKIVSVKFEEYGKAYCYLTDLDLVVGDKAIVESPSGFAVVNVIDVDCQNIKASKWIVDKVDFTAYDERKARQERLHDLKKSMDKKRKELDEFEIFAYYASKDAEMASLYNEYMKLMSN